jgi:hypothetical protein
MAISCRSSLPGRSFYGREPCAAYPSFFLSPFDSPAVRQAQAPSTSRGACRRPPSAFSPPSYLLFLLTFYPGRAPNALCRMPIPSFYLSTLHPIPYTLYLTPYTLLFPRAPWAEYRMPSLSLHLKPYTLNLTSSTCFLV